MLELLILTAFAVSLILCLLTGISILWALTAGLLLFSGYALGQGFSVKQVMTMLLSGISKVRNILTAFVLIGMLTSLWRLSGTIPAIVSAFVPLIHPSIFYLITFLLCGLVSFLTGTSFGTAATIGTICMAMSAAFQLEPMLTGGAILSGAYWGDRCSPISTSALLVSELTETDLFQNLRRMARTAAIPTVISCVIYLLAGFGGSAAEQGMDVAAVFQSHFRLGLLPLLPAVLIIVLAARRVSVKNTMAVSAAAAALIALCYQHCSPIQLGETLLWGYHSAEPEIAAMLDGGGLLSMVRVTAIVCISSSYSGVFSRTHLLDRLQSIIERLAAKFTGFGAMLLTSGAAAMVACNQTLAIMLTHQLTGTLEQDRQRKALWLENSAVVLAPLVPWSIAGSVPLHAVGAPETSLLSAFYLYLLPLWYLASELRRSRGKRAAV